MHYWFSPTMHIARVGTCVIFSLTNKAYCKNIGGFLNFLWFVEPEHIAMDDEH